MYLKNRSYTSYMQLHILHALQIQRTWDLPGMSQTWRWPCRSRRSRNTCILFQELESSLVSSRWFQAIGGSIDLYKILNQYGSNLSWSLLQCGFMAQATGVSSSGSGHKSSWTPWELENCKTSWESLKQINIFEETPPSSQRAIWQRMEMFCLRIGTRSSCKLPSTDSDDPRDCLLSVRERKRSWDSYFFQRPYPGKRRQASQKDAWPPRRRRKLMRDLQDRNPKAPTWDPLASLLETIWVLFGLSRTPDNRNVGAMWLTRPKCKDTMLIFNTEDSNTFGWRQPISE